MADAVSPKEAEVRDRFQVWFEEEFEDLNPIGETARGIFLIWRAGFEAGERKERERCAERVLILERDLKEYGDHLAWCNRHMCWHVEHSADCCDCGFEAVIRGGESQ